MKKTLLLLSFICLANFTLAQPFTLSGVLCNRTSLAIKNASVQLLNNDSSLVSSAWSDSSGKFSLSCGKGDFRLYINAYGFTQRIIGLKNISRHTNLDTIRLDSLQLELSEVVVKGNHHVRKEDRILIFPTSEQKKYSNDGYMLLSNLLLPKIQVDPLSSTVSALGANVTLCIDGREVTQDEIKMLPPKEVSRVEYHDSPRGEFSGKDLVINFITVRRVTGGYIGVRADQELRAGNYLLSAKINHKNSLFMVMYAPGYLNDNGVYSDRTEWFDNGLIQDSRGIPSIQQNQSHSVYLGYNNQTDNQTVSAGGGYNFYRSPFLTRFSHQYSSFDDNETLTEQVTRNRSHSAYGNFFYRKKFYNEAVFRANALVQYSGNKYGRIYKESDIYSTNLYSDEDYYNIEVSAEYSHDFKNRSNFSVVLLHVHKFTDVLYQSENSSEENLNNNETLLLLYYTYPLGKKWTLMGGLGASYLYYGQSGKKAGDYFSPRPSIMAQYRPNQKLYFKYQSYMGNGFPQLSYLNNTEQAIDRWQVRRGNPALERTLYWTNQLDIWSSLWGGQLQGFLKHRWSIHNTINSTVYENNKYVQTYITAGDFHQVTANLGYSKNFWNCFNINLSGGWQYFCVTGVSSRHISEWYGSFSAAYFKKGFYLGLQGTSVRHGLSSELFESRSRAYLTPYVSYSWKDLSIMVYAYNPFWNYKRRNWLDTGIYRLESVSFNSRQDHNYGLRLTWNFSFGRKYKYSEDQINKDRGSAIIQVEK